MCNCYAVQLVYYYNAYENTLSTQLYKPQLLTTTLIERTYYFNTNTLIVPSVYSHRYHINSWQCHAH